MFRRALLVNRTVKRFLQRSHQTLACHLVLNSFWSSRQTKMEPGAREKSTLGHHSTYKKVVSKSRATLANHTFTWWGLNPTIKWMMIHVLTIFILLYIFLCQPVIGQCSWKGPCNYNDRTSVVNALKGFSALCKSSVNLHKVSRL